MKQLIQNLKTGETCLEDVPVPSPGRGKVLIKTTRSLVSLGTERMLVEFGKANLLEKARQQPDKVRQVIDKVKTDGLRATLDTVRNRLDEPLSLGYCNVGRLAEGGGLGAEGGGRSKNSSFIIHHSSFKTGDRVVSNGPHAEYVCVPENLCAKIPDNVTDEEAAFTVIGAIGLQGIRLCNPTFGETVVVIGLGLIGLMTTQMLKANGCRVIGIDIDAAKCDLACTWGTVTINPASDGDVVNAVLTHTGETGADAVIISASSKNNDIISQAARMCRKRGRIILVGVVGLNLNRAEFYEKEISFQVSCSYGPGRYDENYEQKGRDYPIGFVRWTEKRNFEAVLQAISAGMLDVKSLITERVPLADYQKIYGDMGKSGTIASILVYPEEESTTKSTRIERTIQIGEREFQSAKGAIGIIGAGNFTKMTVLPALKKCNAPVRFISSANGLSGTHLAKKYGIATSTTDYREILNNPHIDLVMITTRHNLHARMVVEAIEAGKHVFVEKPLCLNVSELEEIKKAFNGMGEEHCSDNPKPKTQNPKPFLIVGFNRRFSPHIQAIKKALGETPGPMHLTATMNAGAIPTNSWVHDMEVGGGRIIGEACHLIDLLTYLAASPIEAVCMNALGPGPKANTDNVSILLRFTNGSNGVVNYFVNGHKAYPKERMEVFSRGRVAIMDNFRRTEAFGFAGFKKLKTRIDKGHAAQFKMLTERLISGGEALIPFAEIVNVTRASFACIESLMKGCWVSLPFE